MITLDAADSVGKWLAASPQSDLMLAEPKVDTKRPPFFRVVMLNDDFTPMEFVVQVLREVFRKEQHEAVNITMQIHQRGSGICGVYTRDVAETKADTAITIARSHEYPLQCVVERE